MAKKFYADGVTGRVAIFDPAVPAALTNPRANLGAVYFHSDLDYVGVVAVFDFVVTHPARGVGGASTEHSYAVPNHVTGAIQSLVHNLGYVPHALVFIGNNMLPANSQIQNVGSSFRTVAVEVNSTQVRLFETSWVYQHALPAIVQTYKVVLFTPKLVPSGNKTVHITPTTFVASRGKLNSAYNYLRRALTSPMFWFSKGKTADVANGSFKIVTANGGAIAKTHYNGSFAGEPGIGVEV